MLPSKLNFCFFDYETFGKETQGAVSQFAAVRTDSTFKELEHFDVYCKPSLDVVPDPEACFITGITPQKAQEKGVCEYDFAHEISRIFESKANTVVIGYNNINFDDEVTRHLFYRNLINPYAWAYKQGNTRFDALDLVRLIHAIKPDAITVPLVDVLDDDGNVVEQRKSFKLEHLSAANGIIHESAHEALSDVRALISLVELLYKKAPELFIEFFKLRYKDEAKSIVNAKTFGLCSYKFAKKNYISLIASAGADDTDANKFYGWDLRVDPSSFIDKNDEELLELMTMKRDELEEKGLVKHGFVSVKTNKVPMVFDVKHFKTEGVAANCGLSEISDELKKNFAVLEDNLDFLPRFKSVYSSRQFDDIPNDTDLQLYCSKNGGFFSRDEEVIIREFHSLSSWNLKSEYISSVSDKSRLKRMMSRIIGRNCPTALSAIGISGWANFVSQRIKGDLPNSFTSIEKYNDYLAAMDKDSLDERQLEVYNDLTQYSTTLSERMNGVISLEL